MFCQKIRRFGTLGLIFFICLLPALLAYLYYRFSAYLPEGIQKKESANYGTLIQPQKDIPSLQMRSLLGDDDKHLYLNNFKGKWLLISVDSGDCFVTCVEKLFFMRQIRILQNNQRHRMVNLFLIDDAVSPKENIHQAYIGQIKFLYVLDRVLLEKWLPVEAGESMHAYLYLVDPLGHLMMRFPKNPSPNAIKKDLSRLLKWSSSG